MIRILLIFCLLIPPHTLMAQDKEPDNGLVKKYGPRRQISTIVYLGLAGAVLGLSTLSFYGRPQDHLTNIPIGFGVGVVIGTIYMTYQAATNPNEFYREANYRYQPQFDMPPPEGQLASDLMMRSKSTTFSYTFAF